MHLSQFFALHISNQKMAQKENTICLFLEANVRITINLGGLTGTYAISNGRDQSQEHSPFTPPKETQHPYAKWKNYIKASQ